ncbi:hypothetical protein BDF14DRAFT_1784357 [Spinellus fusiger]|nr:hypothetical protein BDF14DRAFT_1784357 [Spinellus fusiger]
MSQQPLKLRHPTQYHLMATQRQDSGMHPLATAPHPAYTLSVRQNRDSPGSDHLDFPDSFSQNFLSPMSTSPLNDFDDIDYQTGLQSFSKQQSPPTETQTVSKKEEKEKETILFFLAP